MPLPRPSRPALTAVGAALAVLAAITPATAGAAQPPPPGSSPPPSAAATARRDAAPHTVTLITGDRVTVTRTPDGHATTTVDAPGGGPAGAHVMTVGRSTYVYPDSALPYLASGALDERLFDVTGLIESGYDDAHTDQLPLIVTYTDAAARSRSQAVPQGARRTRTLSSIQGAALAESRSRAADFWGALTGGRNAAAGRRTAAPVLSSGIAKVWLDGKARALLSDTTAQIGAPAVWASGNTGQNVDVAVLDTGIDDAHPDFSGRIAAEASFVPGEDTTDRVGHGTHVASTVAGTGAASAGRERGVAPGARLHIGKVLDDNGTGQDSWIVAGMEWAAREQHARVISMSLGGDPGEGADPLVQAVDRLSAETGALFVIAAGNAGPAPFSVGSPGTADAALTVGAVDTSDRLAGFSSRGPRRGDNGLKPEITAPGVAVTAARSQYAPMGEGSYLTLSGTSMATPHVAGAAALLAAEHPDWTGPQLKDALVSTARATPQYSPYAGGSGRLDVASAVQADVFATATAFASAHWPYSAGQTVRKDVTYTNTGSGAVTLDLALQAPGVPAGLLTLTSPRVTVPAHGTATVGVVSHLDAADDDTGYSAALTASGPDGAVRARTLVGVNRQSRRITLSVRAQDRDGSALPGILVLKDVARDTLPRVVQIDASGTVDLTLRPSTYAAWMYADVRGLDSPHSLSRAVLSAPEVVADQDRTLVLDASALRRVRAVTPRAGTQSFLRVDQYRSYGTLHRFVDSYQLEPWLFDSLWATPTRRVTQGSYTFATRWRLVQPPLTVSAGGEGYGSVHLQSLSPKPAEGTGRYPLAWAGDGSAAEFAGIRVRGGIAVVRRSGTVAATEQAAAAARAGARLLLILNDGYGPLDAWADLPMEQAPSLPVASLDTDDGARLLRRIRHGLTGLELSAHPYPHYLYDLVRHHDGAIPADPGYRPGPGELARIDESVRDTGPGEAVDVRYDLSTDLSWAMGAATTQVRAQGAYTVWLTAAPGVEWVTQVAVPDLTETGRSLSYRPRSTTAEAWLAPVQHPRLLSDSAMATPPSRIGDIIGVYAMPVWGDSEGHTGIVFDGGTTQQTSLYQGDRLVAEGGYYVFADVSPDPLPYRMVVDATRDLPNRPYSTRTHTEWAFTSAFRDYTTQVPLSLVQLDYAVATDLAGRARRHTALTVTPSHLPGATGTGRIGDVTLEASYDDGRTWHPVRLRRTGPDWKGRLDAPAGARWATLRAAARDTAGNSVSQTVVRAFGLR
ncbi:S8 family serine peptidase [Streptacidiphilus sp. ASG 303]|uniref:S8 family serine peptidase n=1 Tax=Streptacidiphilus sp. ASG 303 TaxID=2896847 RepID=UPI001E5871A3|nr:S8 family serine peptidase [Streptacidiphilus sp. ASG 303]MCD0484317.1 S8 family serine peptidase [Streptacidiphilus sp. ASG 303]